MEIESFGENEEVSPQMPTRKMVRKLKNNVFFRLY